MEEFLTSEYIIPAIVTFLGTTTFATILGAFFNSAKNKYDKSVEYITNERAAWRNTIKSISASISKCEYDGMGEKNVKTYLDALKMNINSYGSIKKNDVLKDGHIWKEIEQLESANDKDNFDTSKELLQLELALLLKYDWERSKKEVLGKKKNVWSFALSVTLIVVHALYYFVIMQQTSFGLFMFEIFIIWCYELFVPTILIDNALEKQNTKRNKYLWSVVHNRFVSAWNIMGTVVLCFIMIVIPMLTVFCLHYTRYSDNIVYEYSKSGNCVFSEYEDGIYQYAVDNANKKIEEAKSKEVNDIETNDIEGMFLKEYQVIFEETMIIDFCTIYVYYAGISVSIVFICILYLLFRYTQDTEYTNAIERMQIEKNSFYLNAIKDLLNRATEANEVVHNIYKGNEKYDCICREALKLTYIHLDNMRKYLALGEKGRTEIMVSVSDVIKKVEREQLINDIKDILKEYRKMNRFIPNISRKKRVRRVRQYLQEICQSVECLNFDRI